jgi:hypothetical protein
MTPLKDQKKKRLRAAAGAHPECREPFARLEGHNFVIATVK